MLLMGKEKREGVETAPSSEEASGGREKRENADAQNPAKKAAGRSDGNGSGRGPKPAAGARVNRGKIETKKRPFRRSAGGEGLGNATYIRAGGIVAGLRLYCRRDRKDHLPTAAAVSVSQC